MERDVRARGACSKVTQEMRELNSRANEVVSQDLAGLLSLSPISTPLPMPSDGAIRPRGRRVLQVKNRWLGEDE